MKRWKNEEGGSQIMKGIAKESGLYPVWERTVGRV